MAGIQPQHRAICDNKPPCRALPTLQAGNRPDLLATSGDFLRVWRVSDEPNAQAGVRLEKLLNNVS
jgi:hypothetical protein